jgi:hypothetical protein
MLFPERRVAMLIDVVFDGAREECCECCECCDTVKVNGRSEDSLQKM